MKQEQFIRIRVKLMEQLRQGAEWSDEEILERIDLLVSETARENRLKRVVLFGAKAGYPAGTSGR